MQIALAADSFFSPRFSLTTAGCDAQHRDLIDDLIILAVMITIFSHQSQVLGFQPHLGKQFCEWRTERSARISDINRTYVHKNFVAANNLMGPYTLWTYTENPAF